MCNAARNASPLMREHVCTCVHGGMDRTSAQANFYSMGRRRKPKKAVPLRVSKLDKEACKTCKRCTHV